METNEGELMKRVTTLLAIVAMWGAVLAAPAAANSDALITEGEFDYFYENTAEELVLVTGPAFEQGCLGEGFTVATMRSVLSNGLYTSGMEASGVEMRLYSAPSFEALINEACGAVFGGGDVPEPIAFGIGSWKYKAWDQTSIPASSFEPPAVGSHTLNSAWATLVYTDGSRAQVRGNVHFIQTDAGPNILVNEVIVMPVR